MKCAKDAGVNPNSDPYLESVFNWIQASILDTLTMNWRALDPAELLDLVSVTRDLITADTCVRLANFSYHINLATLENLEKAAQYRITACTDDSHMRYADDCYDVRANEARMAVLRFRRRQSIEQVSDEFRAPFDVHSESENEGDEIVDLSQTE